MHFIGTDVSKLTLDIAYFDQLRGQLEPEKNVQDNIAGGNDFVTINGQPRHVISYLGDFLFSPQRARTPVKAASGLLLTSFSIFFTKSINAAYPPT